MVWLIRFVINFAKYYVILLMQTVLKIAVVVIRCDLPVKTAHPLSEIICSVPIEAS